ncbi:hypothetical protein M0Q28_01435 [Patescibacteria group bacterium]|nr:hypothetical protein [Patescibacteria group bacterium]
MPDIVPEEKTGVRPVPKPLADDVRVVRAHKKPKAKPTESSLKAELAAQLGCLTVKFSLRVLNQYVRCVLGIESLAKYLVRKAVNESKRKRVSFRDAWHAELKLLVSQARAYTQAAQNTGLRTSQHYFILRAIGYRGKSVFITRHDLEDRVVAIYTGAQFNRKRAFETARVVSHQKATAFRRAKAHLSPR